MKTLSLLAFLLTSQVLLAQFFSEDLTNSFPGLFSSTMTFADVDGDNDQDLLLTGRDGSNRLATLYTNDGLGNFTEVAQPSLEGVEAGAVAFADVDGDNDLDLLITGFSNSLTEIAKLYLNDGDGNFAEQAGTPFQAVSTGSVAFADIDGDDDQDLVLTGQTSTTALVAKLYTNNGQGSFTEVPDAPLEGVDLSDVAFADVDDDDDLDLLLTGRSLFSQVAILYSNDGNGNFTEQAGTPFVGAEATSIAFADVDGDEDLDVVLAGTSFIVLARIARLYINNGNGFFTQASGTPFEGVDAASIAFSDVDGDNDPDLLINGFGSSEAPITKLYTNDGDGAFTEVLDFPVVNLSYGGLALADVDGDSDEDLIISGQSEALASLTKLYRNNDQGTFLNRPAAPFNFDLFPNLTAGEKVFARFRAEEAGLLQISLFTVDGRFIRTQQEWVNSGEYQLPIDCSDLANGSYILQISDGIKNGTQRLLIQH